MSQRAFRKEAKLFRTLKGEECIRAGVGCVSALLLDFRMRHPPNEKGYREPDIGLVSECSWRLEPATKVLVGRGDADEDSETRVQVCEGRRVTRVRVYHPSYMARLRFSDDLSSGYSQMNLDILNLPMKKEEANGMSLGVRFLINR